MSATFLETRSLSRHFGGLHAVEQMDFSLEQGEVRGLIGPNGAGKTTLVSLLSGRLEPSAGSIRFCGRDITRLPAWKRVRLGIAYTFQVTSIYAALAVHENIAIAAAMQRRIHAADGKADRHGAQPLAAIVEGALEATGLGDYRDAVAGELAYGHQRLLEIAMGLALDPALLILDEPTQGLSDGEIEAFVGLVNGWRGDKTILLIEHNMPVVMTLADTISVMDQGRLLAEGTPQAIHDDARVQAAYLGGGEE